MQCLEDLLVRHTKDLSPNTLTSNEMKTEKNNLCGLVSHILIFDFPHLHGHLFALAFCTMYYAEKEVPNSLVVGALRYTL